MLRGRDIKDLVFTSRTPCLERRKIFFTDQRFDSFVAESLLYIVWSLAATEYIQGGYRMTARRRE